MIVRPTPPLWRLFFVWRGSILRRTWRGIAFISALAALVVFAHRLYPDYIPVVEGAPFTLLGIALSIFLAFRNNASYERWWEGRKLWGTLVYACRTFARQTLLLSDNGAGDVSRQRLLRLTAGLIQSLVPYLRNTADYSAVERVVLADDFALMRQENCDPSFILHMISQELVIQRRHDRLTDIDFRMLDETVAKIEAALASCERIRNTPLPFAYTLLLHRTAYLFCFLLPFGYSDLLNWATPFVVGLIAYTFFGLDALGAELEDPFGTESNDLPISAMATSIEINLLKSLGENDLPKSHQPKDFLLL